MKILIILFAVVCLQVGFCRTAEEIIGDGDLGAVKAMITADPSIVKKSVDEENHTLLHFAAIHGKLKIAEILIEKKSPISANTFIGTPLHLACSFGNNEMAKLLIDNGANINVKDLGNEL